MSIQPHDWFDIVRPDQVAECWDGVGDDLYRALWASMSDMKPLAHEDCGPADVIGLNSVASVWSRFTPEQQTRLNQLATRMQEDISDA